MVHQVLQALEGESRGNVVPVVWQAEDAVMLHLPVPHRQRVKTCRDRAQVSGSRMSPPKSSPQPARHQGHRESCSPGVLQGPWDLAPWLPLPLSSPVRGCRVCCCSNVHSSGVSQVHRPDPPSSLICIFLSLFFLLVCRTDKDLTSVFIFPKCLQQLELSQTQARKQELSPGLPHEWQESNYLGPHLLPPGRL